jgi:hypothetical protein
MAPVIGVAILTAVGASAATAAAYGTIVGTIVLTAASIGASYALSSSAGATNRSQSEGAPAEKQSGSQITVREALPIRQRGYGRHKLGGAVFFLEKSSTGSLVQGIVHCEGAIESIEERWLADTNAGIGVGLPGIQANTALPWGNLITIESFLGEDSQSASATLMFYFAGVSLWTSDHHLNGLAYSVVDYKLPATPEDTWQEYYPSGPPPLRIVAQLSKVYVPSLDASVWSDNPAYAILDYLMHPRGFNIPGVRINMGSFTVFGSSVCAEIVNSFPRYRLGGVYSLGEERRDVLKKLMATCDAELYMDGDGLIAIRGGVWTEPTVRITSDMILSYEIEQGNDKLASFNRVKWTYTSPDHDYQPTEGVALNDLVSQASIGVLERDLPLQFVQSFDQGLRLAKIVMHKGNPLWKGVITTNAAGMDALGERIIEIEIAELGIDTTFLVTQFEIAGDLSACTIGFIAFSEEAYTL